MNALSPTSSPSIPAGSGSRPWLPAVAAMFCCGWGGNQFTPLLLMYRKLGGYSEVTVDAFLAAYVVGLVPGLLVAGPLSDRYGRRPLMLAGTAVSIAASCVLTAGGAGQLPIYLGRLLTGVAVGIAMAVGTSWVKELSRSSQGADEGTAARRASLSLTLGFGLGAGVAGALAQWGPWPMVTPYVVHVLATVAALVWLARAVPETRPAPAAGERRSLLADLRVPDAAHPRFVRVVVPLAPWVFGAAGIAYAVMPQLVADRVGSWGLAYATLLTVLTLGTGALVQPLAKRIGARSNTRTMLTGMGLMTCGMALSAGNAAVRSPWLGLVCAMLLGAAYGIAVVSGLLEIQRLASPDALAGLTGVYYTLTYLGFLAPTILAAFSTHIPYPAMLGALAVLALVCLLLISLAVRTAAVSAGHREASTGVVARGGIPGPRSGDRAAEPETADELS